MYLTRLRGSVVDTSLTDANCLFKTWPKHLSIQKRQRINEVNVVGVSRENWQVSYCAIQCSYRSRSTSHDAVEWSRRLAFVKEMALRSLLYRMNHRCDVFQKANNSIRRSSKGRWRWNFLQASIVLLQFSDAASISLSVVWDKLAWQKFLPELQAQICWPIGSVWCWNSVADIWETHDKI